MCHLELPATDGCGVCMTSSAAAGDGGRSSPAAAAVSDAPRRLNMWCFYYIRVVLRVVLREVFRGIIRVVLRLVLSDRQ